MGFVLENWPTPLCSSLFPLEQYRISDKQKRLAGVFASIIIALLSFCGTIITISFNDRLDLENRIASLEDRIFLLIAEKNEADLVALDLKHRLESLGCWRMYIEDLH